MQYILTEEEYQKLLHERAEKKLAKTKQMQALCTKIANEMPVIRPWQKRNEPATPWGCMLDEPGNIGYCDECPVKEICPYDGKVFSQ